MPLDLETVQGAMAALDAQGQARSAEACWRLLQAQGQRVSRKKVQPLYKEALAQRPAQAVPPEPVPLPEAVPPVAAVDLEREALAQRIAVLQAELKALAAPAVVGLEQISTFAPPALAAPAVVGLEQISTFAPPALAAPACAVTSELARFRNAYRAARAKVPASTSLHDPVRREQGAIAYDFHARCKEVRQRLAQARQRAGQWDAQRAVVAFVGQEEAARLLATTEEPRWTLED